MSDFGLSSTISTWGNVLTDYYGTKYDKQESELSYKRAIEERDYMNKYNSPASQMERFKEAGLNPNLIYGQGTSGTQNATPKYDAVKAKTSPKQVSLGSIADYANIDLINETTRQKRLENDFFEDTQGYERQMKLNVAFSGKFDAELKQMKNNLMHENYDEMKAYIYQGMKNDWDIKQFEADLARREMTKNDKLLWRKAVEIADKTGLKRFVEQRLEKELNKSKNQYQNSQIKNRKQ